MNRDDESLHSDYDPVRDNLLAATQADWDWLEMYLSSSDDLHAKGWLRMLQEVREGLNKAQPEVEVLRIVPKYVKEA